MVVVLVKTSNSFRVDYKNIELLAIFSISNDGSTPYPKSLGARVDAWSYPKSFTVLHVKETSIHQETLTGPVDTCHSQHSDRSFDILEDLFGFFAYFKNVLF